MIKISYTTILGIVMFSFSNLYSQAYQPLENQRLSTTNYPQFKSADFYTGNGGIRIIPNIIDDNTNAFYSTGLNGNGIRNLIFYTNTSTFYNPSTGLYSNIQSGNINAIGNITANIFNGSGSGLTGFAPGLTAGVANQSNNATAWNGITNNGMTSPVAEQPGYLMGMGAGVIKIYTPTYVQQWLGLSSNAFSTTQYLPLTGGTITGGLNVNGGQVIITPIIGKGAYSLIASGSAGAPRDIFLAGQSGISNGFTVQYTGSRMAYGMLDGDLSISNGNAIVSGTINVSGTSNLASINMRGSHTIVSTDDNLASFSLNNSSQTFPNVRFYGNGYGHFAGGIKFGQTANPSLIAGTWIDNNNAGMNFNYTNSSASIIGMSLDYTGLTTINKLTVPGSSNFLGVLTANNSVINNTLYIGSVSQAAAGSNALAVNGSAIFNKATVKVYPWSDYVFDEGYKITKLPELEKFIKQNHHLPEIPTAKEVEKDGIDLGSNQALLLKKIEELTLLLIEQNKTIQTQQKDIIELKQLTLILKK